LRTRSYPITFPRAQENTGPFQACHSERAERVEESPEGRDVAPADFIPQKVGANRVPSGDPSTHSSDSFAQGDMCGVIPPLAQGDVGRAFSFSWKPEWNVCSETLQTTEAGWVCHRHDPRRWKVDRQACTFDDRPSNASIPRLRVVAPRPVRLESQMRCLRDSFVSWRLRACDCARDKKAPGSLTAGGSLVLFDTGMRPPSRRLG
jgi:hypothetical protein